MNEQKLETAIEKISNAVVEIKTTQQLMSKDITSMNDTLNVFTENISEHEKDIDGLKIKFESLKLVRVIVFGFVGIVMISVIGALVSMAVDKKSEEIGKVTTYGN